MEDYLSFVPLGFKGADVVFSGVVVGLDCTAV